MVFFFKQKTAYEMCGRDWSSDVCSSDLVDYKDGYVGCMSSLQVNGETLDLYDKVANDPVFQYGLMKGQ